MQHIFQILKCMRGNGALDVVMFMPLAFLFLFVAIDSGYSLLERGQLEETIRQEIASATKYNNEAALRYYQNDIGIVSLDTQAVGAFVQKILDKIKNAVLKNKSQLKMSNDNNLSIDVSVISVEIDSETGAILNGDQFTIISSAHFGVANGANYTSREDYIRAILDKQATTQPSAYASFGALTFDYQRQGALSRRYNTEATLLYVDVRVVPNGLNPSYTESVLGRSFFLQVQQLELLRSQML